MKLCLIGSIIVLSYSYIRVEALTFDQSYVDVNALRFSTVVMPCTVIPDWPNEQYKIYWWGPDEPIMNGTEPMPLMVRWSLNHTSEHVWDLVLENAQTWDSGEYVCSNDEYGYDGAIVNLTVTDPHATRSTSQLGTDDVPSSPMTSMETSSTVESTTEPTIDDPNKVCPGKDDSGSSITVLIIGGIAGVLMITVIVLVGYICLRSRKPSMEHATQKKDTAPTTPAMNAAIELDGATEDYTYEELDEHRVDDTGFYTTPDVHV